MSVVHEIKVPFYRWGRGEEDGYTPGCRKFTEQEYYGHVYGEAEYRDEHGYVADDWGYMLITEIQRVSIPGYEDRIFYTRAWRDPNGAEFGKNTLRCKGARAFKLMLNGWRHPFYMGGELVNNKEPA